MVRPDYLTGSLSQNGRFISDHGQTESLIVRLPGTELVKLRRKLPCKRPPSQFRRVRLARGKTTRETR